MICFFACLFAFVCLCFLLLLLLLLLLFLLFAFCFVFFAFCFFAFLLFCFFAFLLCFCYVFFLARGGALPFLLCPRADEEHRYEEMLNQITNHREGLAEAVGSLITRLNHPQHFRFTLVLI